jgi:hypothetical protein
MSAIILLYFIGAILGSGLIIFAAVTDAMLGKAINSAMFIAFATYIGGPTATAIGFYAWKSKAENLLKISKSCEATESGEVVSILATMEVE